jgi:mannose-6-phosphate isomerase-like protein (cupin superfamily)
MYMTVVSALLAIAAIPGLAPAGQRRSSGGGAVTFAILVQDPTGAPVPEVRVTLSGPAARSSRTERGRVVFEGLPSGLYRFHFEKDGFVSLDREVTGRGSAPIDVKVTLTKVLPPIDPVRGLPPPPPAPSDRKPVVIDMPAFIEKYYVGRAAGKTTPVACAQGGEATLLQMNDAIAGHTHGDADEFLYVIAGQGSARLGERVEPLGPGVFLMIPRGMPHTFSPAVKKPLVALSVRTGQCGG